MNQTLTSTPRRRGRPRLDERDAHLQENGFKSARQLQNKQSAATARAAFGKVAAVLPVKVQQELGAWLLKTGWEWEWTRTTLQLVADGGDALPVLPVEARNLADRSRSLVDTATAMHLDQHGADAIVQHFRNHRLNGTSRKPRGTDANKAAERIAFMIENEAFRCGVEPDEMFDMVADAGGWA